MKHFIRSSLYAILSNLLILVVSSLVVLVLPKIIGIQEYGYWQLYLFYASYVGFAHLGWIDGIYLKYGGEEFEQLDKKRFFSQFVVYTLFQIFVAICLFLGSLVFTYNKDRSFIYMMLAITLIATNVRFFFIYLLQTTNRIQESSRIMILDRLIYSSLLILFILGGWHQYKIMIWADVIGRLLSLFYAIYICRQIVLLPVSNFTFESKEILDNIKIGINLMFSNVASMLIIGIVRVGIEQHWNIKTFGKISLTLSISNLIMVFINALGLVIFPILKRIDSQRLPGLYNQLRAVLMVVLLGVLLAYYPLSIILEKWLPQYQESIRLMILIFPISVFEGKMALLVNTYLKAYRMEKTILFVNLLSMMSSLVLTSLIILVCAKIEFLALLIPLLLFFRSFLAEFILAQRMEITIISDVLMEFIMVVLFILSGWFLPSLYACLVYLFIYSVYLFYKKNDLCELVDFIGNKREV